MPGFSKDPEKIPLTKREAEVLAEQPLTEYYLKGCSNSIQILSNIAYRFAVNCKLTSSSTAAGTGGGGGHTVSLSSCVSVLLAHFRMR